MVGIMIGSYKDEKNIKIGNRIKINIFNIYKESVINK